MGEYMPGDEKYAEKFIEEMRPVLRVLAKKIPRLTKRELEACAIALSQAGKIGWELAKETNE